MATAPLVACSDAEIFDRVAGPRSEVTTTADWPKLAEVETPPPPGTYTEAMPDPAIGDATQIELSVAAESADIRRKAVEGPVE
ncbi:MAG: hypothetical protein AAF367_17875 [Pseudomonadota bacterium]